jgi:hypothetical protein
MPGMTAQQICILAAQIAKGPGFLTQSGQFLSLILQDLYQKRDLKINRITQMITVGPGTYGPFNLESDYHRTYDMFYPMPPSSGPTTQGLPLFLTPITMEQYDSEFKDPSLANYPYEFATDLSTQAQTASGTKGQLYVYPQSSGSIQVTHRYMCEQPDISSPQTSATIPWFENQDYLITALAAKLMMITGDDRMKQFEEDAETRLRPYLIMTGDEQQTVRNIKLDPRRFHMNRNLRPTKVTSPD